ncbi:MAG: peptidoglycan editing factor PgeF [candidate division WOR-3 bacterium]
MSGWVLKAKNNIKYFQLDTQDFDPAIIGLFSVKNRNVDNNKVPYFLPTISGFPIYHLHQIHSNIVYYVDKNFTNSQLASGDGLYTREKNIFLAVRVADCLPIYFWVRKRPIVGIVHAGWRGTLKLVAFQLANQLMKSFQLSPQEIYYAFGPAIGACCYEVKSDVASQYEQLLKQYAITEGIIDKTDKLFLNLKVINDAILNKVGCIKYADLNLCTSCEKELFYSYRRGDRNQYNWGFIGYINSNFNKFS